MLDQDQIIKNYDTFLQLLKASGEERVDNVFRMTDALAERLSTAPASSRKDRHNAFTGGLVDHSLRVFKYARKLNKEFDYKLPVKSLIVSCLFHDLGKVGDLHNSYYIEQNSDWRRNNLGELYAYNPEVKLTTTDRTLWLLQHFQIPLSLDEWTAIRLADGQYVDENKAYKMKEPMLATIVHTADLLATKDEKSLYLQRCTITCRNSSGSSCLNK